ncbi:MAG: hypothetical protein RJB66_1577 [Pseudomonadota bacterium]|jgi:hypothetical protein
MMVTLFNSFKNLISLSLLVSIIVSSIQGSPSLAAGGVQEEGRKVVLDWEPISGAASYDLEVGLPESQKYLKNERMISKNRWEGILSPGQYWMRIRARDDRGVPGDWSERMDIVIRLAKVEVLRPFHETIINTVTDKLEVFFSWKPVSGAKSYLFHLEDEEGRLILNKDLPSTSLRVEVSGMAGYRWSVQAVDEKGDSGDKDSQMLFFSIEGPGLEPPVIIKPETIYIREIEYIKTKGTKSVEVQFERYDPKKNEWVSMPVWNEQGEKIKFPETWKGGRYKLNLRSLAKYQSASTPAVLMFDVFDGKRTAEREDISLIQKAIDRSEDWFSRFSYVVTKLHYEGVNYETDVKPRFEAFTGTASGQASKYLADQPFGFNFGAGIGGILLAGKNTLLTSAETSVLYRQPFGEVNQLRLSLGYQFKEIPQAVAVTSESTGEKSLAISKIRFAGPKIGLEYWRGIDRKLGLQLHAGLTELGQGTTAAGVKLTSGKSVSVGALASYRFTKEMTWLGGYTFTSDDVRSPGYNSATLKSGFNQTQLTAHYLHFMVEYDY